MGVRRLAQLKQETRWAKNKDSNLQNPKHLQNQWQKTCIVGKTAQFDGIWIRRGRPNHFRPLPARLWLKRQHFVIFGLPENFFVRASFSKKLPRIVLWSAKKMILSLSCLFGTVSTNYDQNHRGHTHSVVLVYRINHHSSETLKDAQLHCSKAYRWVPVNPKKEKPSKILSNDQISNYMHRKKHTTDKSASSAGLWIIQEFGLSISELTGTHLYPPTLC